MPFEDSGSHLADILASVVLIERFVGGMDLEAYQWDDKTQAAVESALASFKPTAQP